MTSDKASVVLKTVITRSAEGQVNWTETASENSFEASFANVSMRIVRAHDMDETGEMFTYHYLEILNQNGAIVDTILAYNVKHYIDEASAKFASLFSIARDKALGVNSTIDELLESLGGPIALTSDDKDLIIFDE